MRERKNGHTYQTLYGVQKWLGWEKYIFHTTRLMMRDLPKYPWATIYYVLLQKKLVAYMNVHTMCTRTEKEQARNLYTTKLFWVFASKNCQRVNSGWDNINMQILILFMTVETELNLMMLWTIWPWLYSRQWCFCYNVVATESDQYNNYYYRDFYDMHLRLRQLMLSNSKATYYCLSYIQMKRTKKPVCMKTLILGTVNKTEM